MTTWFTGGHHFGHKNIARYEGRPDGWQSLAVDRWNEVVGDDDLVIHVGDIVWGSIAYGREIVSALKGHKVIILGNHDRSAAGMLEMGFGAAFGSRKRAKYDDPYSLRLDVAGRRVAVSHAPLAALPPGCQLNIHGHIHSNGYPAEMGGRQPWHVNVEVDVTDFYPISLEEQP